ncbi:hypothetical protein WICPIJ_007815 [Wickerhamomyces pijperi]|uniref:Uncharacterized protein n=1 Tax=Wickerhamomyces pijperi TaxID=599730 RepID=A0A9P8PZV4_WICPI|nr:hypothetical protein WICPIJ_007815 [Wickerhamomyces pijperi]
MALPRNQVLPLLVLAMLLLPLLWFDEAADEAMFADGKMLVPLDDTSPLFVVVGWNKTRKRSMIGLMKDSFEGLLTCWCL